MSEQVIAEYELSNFLDEARRKDKLRTWQRQRTEAELGAFVASRLEQLADVDASDFELTA